MSQPSSESLLSQLNDLNVTVEIRKGGQMDNSPIPRYYNLKNPPMRIISCTRPGCQGGWYMDDDLLDMIKKGETEGEAFGICSGHEKMGGTSSRACLTWFSAKVNLSYKPKA